MTVLSSNRFQKFNLPIPFSNIVGKELFLEKDILNPKRVGVSDESFEVLVVSSIRIGA